MFIWQDNDGIIHIRNSERGSLEKCPQQWWWNWRNGLQGKETAKPLWFGEGIHIALAHYYGPGKKRRKDFIDVWRDFVKEEAEYIKVTSSTELDADEWVDARELGESMLTEYVREYDGDKNWDVISTEQEFEVKIPFLSGDGYFILNGTFDGVYRDTIDKKTKLMEHKTAKAISTGHLVMDNQAGTYHMVAQTVGRHQGWLGKNQNISEITYNFLRKSMPDARPKNADGYATNKPLKSHYIEALSDVVDEPKHLPKMTMADLAGLCERWGISVVGEVSKRQMAPLFERHSVKKRPPQRRAQLHRLQAEVERMRMYVDGRLEVTKSPSRDHCGFCPFQLMCELHESGGDWEEYRDALYRSIDPYADHRKSA